MKGYYKNWYQHYLELEKEKEKKIQRGYYSNLAPTEEKVENNVPESRKEEDKRPEIEPFVGESKKKKKFRLFGIFGILLPISTLLGFTFLWYQMDIGPVRHLVDEVFVMARLREETIDVVSYHTSLLDQHVAFAEKVATFINGEDALSFDDLEAMFDEIRETHARVVELSEAEYEEAVRLWSFKISSTQQMMIDLIIDKDVEEAYAQFTIDQREIGELIRAELLIGE